MTPEEIESKLVVPTADTRRPMEPDEAGFIQEFLEQHAITRTLELGFAYGRSASHILAATGQRHVVVDSFQSEHVEVGLKNLERLGLLERLEFHRDFSHNVLPELVKQGRRFEFVLVDGDRKFDGELVDFYFADLLLDDCGYVLLHDTWMRSTRLLMRFIETNRREYRAVPTPLPNLALYQKTGIDQREATFFREFYTFRSLLSHHGSAWLDSGRPERLRNAASWAVEKLKALRDLPGAVLPPMRRKAGALPATPAKLPLGEVRAASSR